MTLYIFSNWVLLLVTFAGLASSILRNRALLIKPSIAVIIFFHLQIQWAATIDADRIENFLPNPWIFLLLAHGFPLLGLLGSLFFGRELLHIVWQRIIRLQIQSASVRNKVLAMLLVLVTTATILYLATVPYSATGLYALFFDPTYASLARENSLALLGNPLVEIVYYRLMVNVLAPLSAVLLLLSLVYQLRKRRILLSVITISLILAILIVVSFPGARRFAASIVLTMLFAFYIWKKAPINLVYILLIGIITLALPVVITLLRQGEQITGLAFIDTLRVGIFGRTFVTPMEMAMWYVYHAQSVGFVGVRANPRLASLFDVSSINVPNMIGLVYLGSRSEYVNANASYVFAYFSYFGWFSFPFSLLGLWLLDIILLSYRYMDQQLLLAAVSAIFVNCSKFVSSEYTVVMNTHGFIFLLVVVFLLSRLFSDQNSRVIAEKSSGIIGARLGER